MFRIRSRMRRFGRRRPAESTVARWHDGWMAHLGLVTIVVDDYDRAITHYVQDLGFALVDDLIQGDKRWVVVAPPGTERERHATHVLLARAETDEQRDYNPSRCCHSYPAPSPPCSSEPRCVGKTSCGSGRPSCGRVLSFHSSV